MNRLLIRSSFAVVLVGATAVAATLFLRAHPQIIHRLYQTPPRTLTLLLLLYGVFMATLWLVFMAMLSICHTKIPKIETLSVTAYSSLVNFFGPLQSGPAFRAIYLKKRHRVSVKTFTKVSLYYYGFYSLFSAGYLLIGLIGLRSVPILLLVVTSGYLLLRRSISQTNIDPGIWRSYLWLALATFAQVTVFAIIFFVELRSVNPSISLGQSFIYTGAANFALFVSITPAAIGFREAFVLITQQLHHIPTATLVTAGLIDRGVYIVTLLVTATALFGTHARSIIQQIKGD